MLKKTMTYLDFDGNERTEDFYFNLTKAEILEMDLLAEGGLDKFLTKITQEQDSKRLVEMFKDLIYHSYGEKSLDGKRFVKTKEIQDAFTQTQAYSDLFMELATDEKAASAFVNGIVPSDLSPDSGGGETGLAMAKAKEISTDD